jgi:hypothetical protein
MCAHSIALRPVDLGQRVIYERREEKKGKKKIHIVPSVTIQFCSRSSNVFAFAHAIKQQQHFITKKNFFFFIDDE